MGVPNSTKSAKNAATDPDRGQITGSVATLPGQSPVRDARAHQTQLGVGDEYQPAPAVGLLGMSHSGG